MKWTSAAISAVAIMSVTAVGASTLHAFYEGMEDYCAERGANLTLPGGDGPAHCLYENGTEFPVSATKDGAVNEPVRALDATWVLQELQRWMS